MAMRMEIDQNEIEAALRKHLATKIVDLDKNEVTFEFSSKRVGGKSISAEVTIAARNEQVAFAPTQVAAVAVEADVIDDAEDEQNEPQEEAAVVAPTEVKSLFGAA